MNPKPCWCGFTLAHLGAHLFLSLISFQVILALSHLSCSSSLFFSWPRGSYHKIKLCHLSCYCWMSCLSNAPGGFTLVWFPFRALFLCLCPRCLSTKFYEILFSVKLLRSHRSVRCRKVICGWPFSIGHCSALLCRVGCLLWLNLLVFNCQSKALPILLLLFAMIKLHPV